MKTTFFNRLIRFQISWDTIAEIPGSRLPWAPLRTVLTFLLAHCEYDVLILDEPTFGLGWEQRMKLRSFLSDYLIQGHIIIVSHDRDFIFSICDQIIDLDVSTVIQNSLVTYV